MQVSLKTSALGSSVEEVEQLIRKHETFQKVLTAQDEKVIGWGFLGHGQRWELGQGSPGVLNGGHRYLVYTHG